MKRQPWSTQNKRMLAYPPSPLSSTPHPHPAPLNTSPFYSYEKTDFFFQRDNANTGRQFSKDPWLEGVPTYNELDRDVSDAKTSWKNIFIIRFGRLVIQRYICLHIVDMYKYAFMHQKYVLCVFISIRYLLLFNMSGRER